MGSKIPPVIPASTIAPLLYVLLTFVLPMAPVIGGFCPMVLYVLLLAFGAKNVMNVTLHNASRKQSRPQLNVYLHGAPLTDCLWLQAADSSTSEKGAESTVKEAVSAAANGDAKAK